MKKFGQIVLVFLLSVGMFTGCGTSYKADESTVFVLKDGKIVSTDVENFDEKTYDKDGLKEYVKNEIDTYNEKNGKGSVSLKKLDTGEKKATLTIAYRTAEDYQKFNDMELYTGSVAEALAAGYSFDGSFASVKNGKIKACESSAFLDDSSCKVVVIRGNTNVKVKGTICYVSTTIPVMWMHRPLRSKKERPFLQRKKQQRERKVPQRQQAHRLRKRQERYPMTI
jgi:hypothetical protein